MTRIVIDQEAIRLDPDLVRRGATPFPRPLTWWQKTLPIWVDAAEDENGRIILTPNGRTADGRQMELTPARTRRYLKAIQNYLARRRFLDFTDACTTTKE